MLKCPSCGNDNEFGRVFCTKCGAKLDLSQMNNNQIEDLGKKSATMSYWPVAVLAVIIIAIALVGLALWGRIDTLGQDGVRSESRIIKNQLAMFRRLGNGQTMGAVFSEKQINSYLLVYKVQQLKLESFSVSVVPEALNIRLVHKYGPYGIGTFQKQIYVSLDLECVAEGNNLVVKSGAIGHMPLPGPLAVIPQKMVWGSVSASEEWGFFEALKEISLEEGRIKLHFER